MSAVSDRSHFNTNNGASEILWKRESFCSLKSTLTICVKIQTNTLESFHGWRQILCWYSFFRILTFAREYGAKCQSNFTTLQLVNQLLCHIHWIKTSRFFFSFYKTWGLNMKCLHLIIESWAGPGIVINLYYIFFSL